MRRNTSRRQRQDGIRKLFDEYRAFVWAASLPFDPTTEENFRQHLILFSIKDQGRDSRDAFLWLQELCLKAATAGVSTIPVLKEVAQLSNDRRKYVMGSTKEMLLKAC